jgi:hypothetical protein
VTRWRRVKIGLDLGLDGPSQALVSRVFLRPFAPLVVEAFLGDSCVMRNPGAAAPSVVVVSISDAGGGRLNWMWISRSHI